MSGLSGRCPLSDLLEAARLPRSSYYCALAHPKAPARPGLWEAAAEVFPRAPSGCGHRRIAMRLRAGRGAVIAGKTALEMMREMGVSCGTRRETDRHGHGSHKGRAGKTFENVIGGDFAADGPWQKTGADVAELRQPWGKARFAPVYGFAGGEIVARSTSMRPNMAQQHGLPDRLLAKMPKGSAPVLHSDMGWQYRQPGWCGRLKADGAAQGMSRKGDCIDNGATEQVLGHMKDEFFKGRPRASFEGFERDLDAYAVHWNTRRRQVEPRGPTPEESRNQPPAA